MREIIDFCLVILIAALAFLLLRFISKRLRLFIKLTSLARKTGGTLRQSSPLVWLTPRPKCGYITLEILNTVYRIRLFSGGNGSRCVHFIDERFSVSYSRFMPVSVQSTRVRARARVVMGETLNLGARVHLISPFEKSNTTDVIIFCPAPSEVSFVEGGASVKLAFSGDEMLGAKVFTTTSFTSYAERKYRESKPPEAKFF